MTPHHFAMHPEQLANQLVLRFLGSLDRGALREIPDDAIRLLRNSIRESLRFAQERERDACAALAAQHADPQRAAAIRARTSHVASPPPATSGSSVHYLS
jgi:hypothetical protein